MPGRGLGEVRCQTASRPRPGNAFDDSGNGWMTDAINPMSAMFRSRRSPSSGNHEACDAAATASSCSGSRPTTAATREPLAVGAHPVPANPAVTDTWMFVFNVASGRRLKVAMVDSAYGTDDKVTAWVPNQGEGLPTGRIHDRKADRVESWLMTHRPIFGRQAGNGFCAELHAVGVQRSGGGLAKPAGNYS